MHHYYEQYTTDYNNPKDRKPKQPTPVPAKKLTLGDSHGLKPPQSPKETVTTLFTLYKLVD